MWSDDTLEMSWSAPATRAFDVLILDSPDSGVYGLMDSGSGGGGILQIDGRLPTLGETEANRWRNE